MIQIENRRFLYRTGPSGTVLITSVSLGYTPDSEFRRSCLTFV